MMRRELGLGMQTVTPILVDAPAIRGGDLRADIVPILTGGVALALIFGFGAWFLTLPAPPGEPVVAAARSPAPVVQKPAATRSLAVAPTANPYGALIAFAPPAESPPPLRGADPSVFGPLVALSPQEAPLSAARVDAGAAVTPPAPAAVPPPAPLPPRRQVAELDDTVPLPPARPNEFASLAPPPAAADRALGPGRSLEQPTLAYAAPETSAVTPAAPAKTSIFSLFNPQPTRPAGYDDHTAVYDISAKALYLPDGTKIEAHSGLGSYMDDPSHVDERLKGATPPDLYDLQLREAPFHGVTAIRLLPVGGESAIYGRAGLLAHPFMMGDNGDSNGCVSIKDYEAFLKAFQDGKVTRLAVVAKL